jgi:ferredoxin-NADP reductase
MNPIKTIDKYLNNITMYSLLLYGLSALLAGAVILSLLGKLYITTPAILASTAVIVIVAYIADHLLPIIWEANVNNYSSLITALILVCILPPSTHFHNLALMALGTLIAITSKYVISAHYKHLFNPAAFGALILGVTSLLPATWWIGSPDLLPLTLIFGLLVLRKVRRFQLFFSFLVASLIVAIPLGLHHDQSVRYIISTAFRSSPLIFLGSVMLTEPSTTPPRAWEQRIYGLIVGAIFTCQLSFGSVSATPELALIVGNIYAYIVSPKYKLRLRLKSKTRLTPQIYDFGFEGGQKLNFKPGQYLEWTLPRTKPDLRGNRRVFSIASAPGEEEIHIATKTSPVRSSSFKTDLVALNVGDVIVAAQLAGDFVLPHDLDKKLVFLAGGIGITPFISMVKNMILTKQKRDIVLLYLVSSPIDFCYRDLWKQASSFGLSVIPILSSDKPDKSWQGVVGQLNENILNSKVPDYKDRRFYISGPNALVENYSGLLRHLGVKRTQIVTDHFSGY